MTVSNHPSLLAPEAVSAILGVTTHTLAVWRCSKRMPLAYVKVGGRVRYRPADVERFINTRTCPST